MSGGPWAALWVDFPFGGGPGRWAVRNSGEVLCYTAGNAQGEVDARYIASACNAYDDMTKSTEGQS